VSRTFCGQGGRGSSKGIGRKKFQEGTNGKKTEKQQKMTEK